MQECLSLVSLVQCLWVRSKPIRVKHISSAPLYGKILALPENIRQGACILKHITAVIYGFRNKLECLSLNTRLGWKGLPGTNTQAY
jgi:hypothetical protein